MSADDLVPVFMPALGALLLASEDSKGSPLTEAEVIAIRDKASCIMMDVADAEKLAQTRGRDLDPENCWYDFQALRKELGRKPDIDGGTRVAMFARDDAEMADAVRRAQETLERFRAAIDKSEETAASVLFKTRVVDGEASALLWLADAQPTKTGLSGVLFEVPTSFTTLARGTRLTVDNADVLDWMVNDDGAIEGGYSLRLHRSRLPEAEQVAFDEHVGARRWV